MDQVQVQVVNLEVLQQKSRQCSGLEQIYLERLFAGTEHVLALVHGVP